MTSSLLYINGLNGHGPAEQPFETCALAQFEADGVNTEHAQIQWRRADFEGTVNRLEEKVRELAELGAVSIAGFSAGGSMAMHVFKRTRDIEDVRAMSIAGRLQVGHFHPLSPRHLRHASHRDPIDPNKASYPAFFDSVYKLEHFVLPSLSDADRARLTVLKPKLDFVVPSSTRQIDGVETVVIDAYTHHRAGAVGLRYLREKMKSIRSSR